jgi:hypothetical protein
MSTACAFFAPDPEFGAKGPGFNAWNMRGRGWLDESRVWHGLSNPFDEVIQLSPLHRYDLPGFLAAELPPIDGHFLVEFRIKDLWDVGIPRSAALVHRFEGVVGQFLGSHSYIMSGTRGNQDLVEGDTLDATASGPLEVFALGFGPTASPEMALHMKQMTSSSSFSDWSQLGNTTGLVQMMVISGINGGLEVFAVDTGGTAWTNWQNGPNGYFEGWATVGNRTGFRQITAGRNEDGRLEAFAIDAQGVPWHSAQPNPTSGFPDWSQLGNVTGLEQMMVISGINGGLEVFAVDTAGAAWTNWQNGPNGGFEGWEVVGNRTGFRQITAGRNADGRLEAFAIDKSGQPWHTAQPDPASGFPDWSRLGSNMTLEQIAVARNADVAIHVEVLKIDEQGRTATIRLSSSSPK